MFSRRDFLKLASLAWPASAWSQVDKKGKPPPGILVNDIHSQLNSTRVWRIVQPDTLDRSTSSSLTAALFAASMVAFMRSVSFVACSKTSASLKLNAASALGSGFFASDDARVP